MGRKGTKERDLFGYELQMDLIGKAIKQTRQERNLIQEEVGKHTGRFKKHKFHALKTMQVT